MGLLWRLPMKKFIILIFLSLSLTSCYYYEDLLMGEKVIITSIDLISKDQNLYKYTIKYKNNYFYFNSDKIFQIGDILELTKVEDHE